MEEQVRETIDRLNAALGGQPFRLAVVDIAQLELMEKNARFMTNETFRNLVANIKRDGALASIPFCRKVGDGYRVLSGNNRVRAAREAGLKTLFILYTDRELTREEEVAIQLSHNSLVGQDDPAILRELWTEIRDLQLKYYSGLDDKLLKNLQKAELDALREIDLEYRAITILFLPEEVGRLDEVFQRAMQTVSGKAVYLARFAEFDRLMAGLSKTQKAYNIRNVATALMLMLDILEAHMTDLAEGWEGAEDTAKRQWVPLASILGGDEIPIAAAKVVKQAVDRMRGREEISNKNLWQALEYWAADYLAGSQDP